MAGLGVSHGRRGRVNLKYTMRERENMPARTQDNKEVRRRMVSVSVDTKAN